MLDAGLDKLKARIPGEWTPEQLAAFRANHACTPASVQAEGRPAPVPCAFPGCERGTDSDEIVAGGRLRLRRVLRWFGGPQFEWQRPKR